MKLFETYDLGGLTVKNRIVMAPMTRSRASADGVHGELAATYYGQRAGAGLIITEATAVSKGGSGYPNIPGIWNEAQVKGWQGVTKAVHDKGGKIILQMFHTGRIGHSSLFGAQPVSSTGKPPEGQVMAADYSMQPYETPRALKIDKIRAIVAQFETGSKNAYKAGFDGVEIHAANGYLIDQFLRDGVNDRTDEYGGSLENRARLLREILGAVIMTWNPRCVGVRISPYNPFNGMSDSNPLETFSFVADMMTGYPVAYLHMMEPVAAPDPAAPRVSEAVRKIYKGTLMVNGGLTKDIGEAILEANQADLVCYGSLFISNPDLVERFRTNAPLAAPNQALFYSGGEKGYIDYPAMDKAA